MTPAQEAKEFAAKHGLLITPKGRRYVLSDEMKLADEEFAEVGSYPAALNAMKRYVGDAYDRVQKPIVTDHVSLNDVAPTGRPAESPLYAQRYGRALRGVPVELASGEALDGYGAAFGARSRHDGETDAAYREVVRSAVGRPLDDAAKRIGVKPEVLTQMHSFESSKGPYYLQVQVSEYKPRGPWCAVISYKDQSDEGEYFATRAEAVQDIRRVMSGPCMQSLRRAIARVNITYHPEYAR